MKIAVIGAGIFGCLTALEASNAGHKVTLLEKKHDILSGATPKSQNRLHLGLHYPRDLATARQSIDGFRTFSSVFCDAINTKFPNYYAIAKESSKVSVKEFENFARAAGITIKEFDNGFKLENEVLVKNVSRIWECHEGVIDMDTLREMIRSQIESSQVELRTDSEVKTLEKGRNQWRLLTEDEESTYDFVIKCTYSSDSITIESQDFPLRSRLYHKTLIQVIESGVSNFGITIVDGDFLTILPQGFTNSLLAYGPSVSTRRAIEATSMPENWSDGSQEEINQFRSQIRERIDLWLEDWEYELSEDYLETTRTIEVGVEATDRRTSQVLMPDERFMEIWSGKIDHAIGISRKIPGLLSGY